MEIDVLINSCARPDVLDKSFSTFKQKIKTSHKFRYVLLEDVVENKERQRLGRQWIEEHNDSFDDIVYADKRMGPGFFFAPIVSRCKSDYFFHLEDDNEFIVEIDTDPIFDLMRSDNNIVEIMLNRGPIRRENNLGRIRLSGQELTKLGLFSVATGIFNTSHTKRIIEDIGWEERLNEFGSLTPTAEKFGLKRFVLGHGAQHYKHVGEIKRYKKGGWK